MWLVNKDTNTTQQPCGEPSVRHVNESKPGATSETRNRNVVMEIPDPTGLCGILRFNHLHPPFNNPAIRRALLGAVVQGDYMTAVIGTDRSLWKDGVGFFPPGTPLANDVGLDALNSPRDMEKVKRDLAAAGLRVTESGNYWIVSKN